jgi:hypothetical protein
MADSISSLPVAASGSQSLEGLTIRLVWDNGAQDVRVRISDWTTGADVEFAVDLTPKQAQYVFYKPRAAGNGSAYSSDLALAS